MREPVVTHERLVAITQARAPALFRVAQRFGRVLARIPVVRSVARRLFDRAAPWMRVERLVSVGRSREAFEVCLRSSAAWASKAPGSMQDWLLLRTLAELAETLQSRPEYESLLAQARIDRRWAGVEASWAALHISRAAHARGDRSVALDYADLAVAADETEPNAAAWLAWLKGVRTNPPGGDR